MPHTTPPTAALTPPRVARQPRSPGVRRTLLVILALNLIVVAIKVVVGIRTGALSVLGASLESALDAINNLVGMAVVSVAAREPDEDHPYGHDKFETLGAIAIVGFLSISCFELLRQGASQLLHREPTFPPTGGEIALLAATGVINLIVVWYERKRGRELGSAFLLADAAHTSSDLYVTLLALASLGLARLGYGRADPVLAIVVALLIAWNGYQILRESVPILVDRRAVDAGEIRRLVCEIPHIEDVRGVRSRSTASGILFAEVTIAVDGGITVADAHVLADQVELRIGERLGASEVTVHVEPAK
ncbi:MAG TPA: cation diffusion facilitator family transporter [Gemmatimonadaceae bacterium]|nr:cation diffusion facilitator family transporter [Gemmatimonadaceae bacterium]